MEKPRERAGWRRSRLSELPRRGRAKGVCGVDLDLEMNGEACETCITSIGSEVVRSRGQRIPCVYVLAWIPFDRTVGNDSAWAAMGSWNSPSFAFRPTKANGQRSLI